jgi:hypothetical protein
VCRAVPKSHDGSIHHDVAQLDVAMAELVGVQVADRVDHPDEESAGLLGRQRAAIPTRVPLLMEAEHVTPSSECLAALGAGDPQWRSEPAQ